MRLFLIEKNKVIPNPAALLIAEFKQIYLRDKSKDKEQALKELAFVYFLADYKSVYLSVPPEEREQVIIEDVFEDNYWKPDKEVQLAVRKYQELQEVPTMRLLDGAQEALEQLIVFFKRKDLLTKVDKSGKPIYKPGDITKAMGETSRVAEAIDTLRNKVKRELDVKGKIQGENQTLGDFEE